MDLLKINADYDLKEKKLNKRKKFKKTIIWLKLILILLLLGAVLVPLALSPLCNISSIEVLGNKHYKSSEITKVTDVKVGENGFRVIGRNISGLLTFRYYKAETDILKNCTYVKSAKVKYKMPDKILITIEERNPMCIIPHLGSYLIMDEEGYIIDIVEDEREVGLPVIKGLKIESYKMGQALELENPDSIEKIYDLITAIKKSDENSLYKLEDTVDYIDISDPKKVCLFVDSRIIANLGDLRDLNYRIGVLKYILQNSIKEEDRGILDFTSGDKPIFRPEE
ncbi:MAG TPA: FtsQ-type POTRA domain-containing protein [Clostridiaceae bacterium]|nr:FtsQ-type POTRA domain-containing protein [Clostridiaceae bacterium]